MNNKRQNHDVAFAKALNPELRAVHQRYDKGDEYNFTRRVTGKLRLPTPFQQQDSNDSQANDGILLLPMEFLDDSSAASKATGAVQDMLKANAGILLIVVTKSITYEAAYQEYPVLICSQHSRHCNICHKSCAVWKQPLATLADCEDSDTVECIAHIAILVHSSKKVLTHQLQQLSEPPYKDIPASLKISLNAAADPVHSLRLNIRQPAGNKPAEVLIGCQIEV